MMSLKPSFTRAQMLQLSSTNVVQGVSRSRPRRSICRATAAAVAAPPPAKSLVITRLVGQPVLQLSPGHSVVPLLSPADHSLPFAASLQVYRAAQPGAATPASQGDSHLQQDEHQQQLKHQGQPSSSSSSLVELSYVLSGRGSFVTSSPAGSVQQLAPGDSVIALQGAVAFRAATAAAPTDQGTSSSTQHAAASAGDVVTSVAVAAEHQQQHNAWWQLVSQLQQLPMHLIAPFDRKQPAQQQQEQQEQPPHTGQQQQLVMLQLVMPADLLTGELECHAGHCEVVAKYVSWASSSSSSSSISSSNGSSSGRRSASSVDKHTVCELLSGVTPLADPQQQQQQQHVAATAAAAGSSTPPGSNQQQQQEADLLLHGTDASSTDSSQSQSLGICSSCDSAVGSPGSPAGSNVLPLLSQRSVLKRALSDVGAFRLPHQTNRLALVFGPHASPPVCLSFGVEVFEPRHVTPVHIHNTAHELFFVMAGRAEGVYGPQRQRCAMSAGDVAVFPPGVLHGIDNPSHTEQLYCLQMMLPNESFVEFVRSGEAVGVLDVAQLQRLAAAASCG